MWPDFHGNRSPLADPTLKGMVLTHALAFSLKIKLCILQNEYNFVLYAS